MLRQKLRRIVLLALTLLPMTAFALTLDEARAQGLVGEDWTGYVAAVVAESRARRFRRSCRR